MSYSNLNVIKQQNKNLLSKMFGWCSFDTEFVPNTLQMILRLHFRDIFEKMLKCLVIVVIFSNEVVKSRQNFGYSY